MAIDCGNKLLFKSNYPNKADRVPGGDSYTLSFRNGSYYLYYICPRRRVVRDYSSRCTRNFQQFVETRSQRDVVKVDRAFDLNDSEILMTAHQERTSGDICKTVLKRLNGVIGSFVFKHTPHVKLPKASSEKETFTRLRLVLFPGMKDHPNVVLHPSTGFLVKRQPLHQAVEPAFGTNGKKTRRLVLSRIEEANFTGILCIGMILKGLVPLDFIQRNILEQPHNRVYLSTGTINPRKVRQFFRKFRQNQLRRFLEHPLEGLNDTIRMFDILPEERQRVLLNSRFNSFRELHDTFAVNQRRYEQVRHESKEIVYTEKEKALDGLVVGDLTIRLPSHTQTLFDWGGIMHNCIASYWQSALAKSCLLLGVFKRDYLMYNIEIRSGHINQFKAARNKPADPEEARSIGYKLWEMDIVQQTPLPPKLPEEVAGCPVYV